MASCWALKLPTATLCKALNVMSLQFNRHPTQCGDQQQTRQSELLHPSPKFVHEKFSAIIFHPDNRPNGVWCRRSVTYCQAHGVLSTSVWRHCNSVAAFHRHIYLRKEMLVHDRKAEGAAAASIDRKRRITAHHSMPGRQREQSDGGLEKQAN